MSSIAETKAQEYYPQSTIINDIRVDDWTGVQKQLAFTAGHKEGAISFAEWFSQKDRPATATWEQLYEIFNQGAHV